MFRAPYRVVLMRGNAKNPRLRHEGGRAIRERFPSESAPLDFNEQVTVNSE